MRSRVSQAVLRPLGNTGVIVVRAPRAVLEQLSGNGALAVGNRRAPVRGTQPQLAFDQPCRTGADGSL